MVKNHATSKIALASTARSYESRPGANNAADHDIHDEVLRSRFTSAAIGMSWQLALIVLLPIVGGYQLDQRLNTLPAWTLVGLVVAMVGSIYVIRRALQAFGNFSVIGSDVGSDPVVAKRQAKILQDKRP